MTPRLLPFDLETYNANDKDRPDFVRMIGYKLGGGDIKLALEPDELVRYLEESNLVGVGHNILAFDLVALARHHGLNLPRLLGRVVDTDTLARLYDPPPSGKDGVVMRPKGYYGLDETSGRFGLTGKTDNLKEIAKEYKGFDNIPVEDERFQDYLVGDVEAHEDLFTAIRHKNEPWPGFWKYASREMRVGLITSQMTVSGLRVDVPEIQRALEEQAKRKLENVEEIAQLTGMPTRTRMGPFATEDLDEKYRIKSPVNTDAGREKITEFLLANGLKEKDIPRTAKTGKPAIGGDNLKLLLAKTDNPEVHRVLNLAASVVGERTIYETADKCRCDDRVHPQIKATQASGRWSVTAPGLTVFGKRGGRHVERRIILPDIGHSLLSIDLDQIDQRAIAAHSQDQAYMEIFQSGRDLHGWLAEKIFGSLEYREKVKPIIHGWTYGRSIDAIIRDGVEPDIAEQFDREMRRDFRKILLWQEIVRSRAAAGALLDNGFGRKMRSDPRFAYTQAPALVGQGCARDLLAEGLLRMPLEFWPYLRVIVHDEIVLSVPAADAEEIGREAVKCMEFEFKGVPITAGCSKPAANWALCYDK